tara:strand:+ start:313 stop:6288 length:5976 start_codon:yes stop_codon:yes gene_type:complete
MAITSYNIAPYFDDYNIKDGDGKTVSDKNYLRILFQPGFAVQTRELNQMQSILQAQIDRFGSSFYRDGQAALDGEASFKDEVLYIEVTPPSSVTADQLVASALLQKSIEVRPTGNEANIYVKLLAAEKISSTSVRLYCTPIEAAFDSPSQSISELIPTTTPIFYYKDTKITTAAGATIADTVGLGTVSKLGYAFGANVEEGIYFIKGSFVHTPKLTKFWLKRSRSDIVRGDISLRIDENIISSAQDSTLLDNSSGSYNFAAPGADRYQIVLSLIFEETNDLTDVNPIRDLEGQTAGIFVKGAEQTFSISRLFTINESGVIVVENTQRSELETKLAQRTFEESGNYVLKPFKIGVRNFLNENQNEGRYDSPTITSEKPFGVSTVAAAKSKFLVEINGSTAYLNGFRYDFPQKTSIAVDRARTSTTITDAGLSFNVGNYVDISLDASPSVLAKNAGNINVERIISGESESPASAVIKSLSFISNASPLLTYRAYLFNDVTLANVKNALKGLSNVENITGFGGITNSATNIRRFEANGSQNLVKLPYDSVRRVTSGTYHVYKKIENLSSADAGLGNGTDKITITDGDNGFTETTAADKFNYTIIEHINNASPTGRSRIVPPAQYSIKTASSGTGTIIFEDVTSNLSPMGFTTGGNKKYTVIAPVKRTIVESGGVVRTKTKKTNTTYGATGRSITNVGAGTKAVGTVIELAHQDIVPSSIRLLTETNQNSFDILDDGLDNPDFYGKVKIKLTEGKVFSSSNSPHVTYEYYEHGTGDFFSVNSYGNYSPNPTITQVTEYEDIPKYRGQSLADFLDFRTKIGDQTTNQKQVVPNKTGTVSFSYFLPRQDRIVLDPAGNLSVITGVPETNPEIPEQPNGAISLYTYFVPAYTGKVNSIIPNYIDNSRFTMRQIGGIKKRVENLEYYTALSVLENSTLNKRILDDDGNEQFKNGLLVDTFRRDSFADFTNAQYLAAMDKENGILRPYGIQNNYRLFYQFPEETDTTDLTSISTDYYNVNSPNDFTFNTTAGRSDPTTGRPGTVIAKSFDADSNGVYVLYNPNTGGFPEYRLSNLGLGSDGNFNSTVNNLSTSDRRLIRIISTGQSIARWELQDRNADGDYVTVYHSTNTGSAGHDGSFPTSVTSWTSGGVVKSGAVVQSLFDDITARTVDSSKGVHTLSTSAAARNNQVRSGFNNFEQLSLWKGEKLITDPTTQLSEAGFGTERYLEQTNCTRTISVQPFENPTYQGKLKLSPQSDEWVSTNRRPNITVNNDAAASVIEFLENNTAVLNGLTGTEWNSWQTTWQSREFERIAVSRGQRVSGGRLAVDQITDVTTSEQVRTGVSNEIAFNELEESTGDRVLNINIVPFIRSRDIGIYASGLKPNTRIYVFFDGVDVTRYCAPTADFVEYGKHESVTLYGADGTDASLANDLPDSTGSATEFTTTAINHYDIPMYTTAETGEFFGTFRIPNNDTLQFRTGLKEFKITSSPLNNDDEADCFAEATYAARGIVQDVAEVVQSTRVPQLQTTQLQEERTVVTDRSRTVRWTYDPVAQTFLIDEEDHPEGLFVTDVDVFFSTKPDYIADAQVYLVTTDNGLPTTTVVPGSHVTLPYQQVKVPPNGREETNGANILDNATNFRFDHPVYLEAKKEYALVVFSKSPDYRVWISELGGANLTNSGIPLTSNPELGVLLKSQNGRTWTPDQMKDLMFRLNKAVFQTSGTFTFQTKASSIYGDSTQGLGDGGTKSISTFNIADETLILPRTTLNYNINFQKDAASGSSNLIQSTYGIPSSVKGRTTYDLKKVIDTDVENVDNIIVTATMTAPDRGDGYSDITPVLDLERMSLIGVKNYLDTSSTANDDVQGYISKKVSLSYPAEAVRVFVNTNRVSSDANLNVYARIKPSEITGIANDTPFEQRPWQKMSLLRTNGGSTSNLTSTGTTNSPALRINDNSDTFTEHEFRFEPSGVTASANNFDEYAIKIGWTGTDAAKIVKVKDLRAIATS